MTAEPRHEVLGLQLSVGDHICGFYRKPAERDDILIPFLVEGLKAGLRELGFEVELPADSHLCCGSAGTYSVLQPELAQRLRERKLADLGALKTNAIVSANIGCIQHLQAGTDTPVRHWVEVVDQALSR